MSSLWSQDGDSWWLRDLARLPEPEKLSPRALRGYWQTSEYVTAAFGGSMLLANPGAQAPELRIPVPASGRFSVIIGMPENYSDRLLIKLASFRTFEPLAHGDVTEVQSLQECWWRDLDLMEGDVIVLKQDAGMAKRVGIAFIRLAPAPAPTAPEVPFLSTVDGFPGNNGPLELDEMLGEELRFDGSHVTALCHGTDICGMAQYTTDLPHHRYPVERWLEEECISHEYYPWVLQQMAKFEAAGRCSLRESIEATHSIGRQFYAYHRMGITQLYAPMRMFGSDLFDAHPEWRCVDFDGTPITRLSIAFPEVQIFFLEHLQETVERGADGVCLVMNRAWPSILFEAPVAEEYERRTGHAMTTADDPVLLQIRTEIFTNFMRAIRRTIDAAGAGRPTKVVALTLAQPAINRFFAMDWGNWAREGLVDMVCPYPYGYVAKPTAVIVPEWKEELAGSKALLCPILNRMTYEPAGIVETPLTFVDRAEAWLNEGADGFSFWDLDGSMVGGTNRQIAFNIGSAEGRRRLRRTLEAGPVRYALKSVDGLTVDRYHPGWNV